MALEKADAADIAVQQGEKFKGDFSTYFTDEHRKHKSHLARLLTYTVWERYKDSVDSRGVPFKNCVFSGIKHPDAKIGLYAGSSDSYIKWSELFDPVIELLHNHGENDFHVSNMDPSQLKNCEFSGEEAAMIGSTKITVGRNCEGYH